MQPLQSLDAIEIPNYAVDTKALHKLCVGGANQLGDLQPESKKRPAIWNAKLPESETKHVKTTETVKEQVMVPYDGGEDRNLVSTPRRGRPAPAWIFEDTPPQEEVGTEIKQEKPSRKRKAKTAEEIDKQIEKTIENRENVQKQRNLEDRARAILREHGVDYTFGFQEYHKGLNVKGHWKDFLMGVMGQKDISCERCQKIVMDYKLETFRMDEPIQDSGTSQPTEQQLALVPVQPVPGQLMVTPPKRRVRAGRPKKTEGPEFNLLTYLEQKRGGMYRFLDRKEAEDRLAERIKKEPTSESLDSEMRKHPAHCQLCGTFLHFPYFSNSLALNLGYLPLFHIFHIFPMTLVCFSCVLMVLDVSIVLASLFPTAFSISPPRSSSCL